MKASCQTSSSSKDWVCELPNERGTSLSPFSRTGTDRERGHGSKKGGVESRGKEGDGVLAGDKDS